MADTQTYVNNGEWHLLGRRYLDPATWRHPGTKAWCLIKYVWTISPFNKLIYA